METYVDLRSVAVAVLLVLCNCKMPAVLAQSSGFLNIDCGGTSSYVDPVTGFTWVPDSSYISSLGKIQTPVVPAGLKNYSEMKTLRYFDDLRPKNCYTLPVTANSTYLLRASFFYGNYDNANQPPLFQFAIDATILDTVNTSSDAGSFGEYHYVAQGSVTYVCLIRTSPLSTPFISGISLKPATALTTGFYVRYDQFLQDGIIMKTVTRVNFGGTELIRAPHDFYDRFWYAEGRTSTPYYLGPTNSSYQFLSTNSTFVSLEDQDTNQPSVVMQTAVTSNGTLKSLLLPPGWTEIETSMYLIVYYGELVNSVTPTPRSFTIQALGSQATISMDGTFLDYSSWNFWSDTLNVGPTSTITLTPLTTSLAGPILNCMEVFAKSGPRVSKTVDRDALAIEGIKEGLNLTEWTGDPCLPSPHSWITCVSLRPTTSLPTITAVNLSGYQLQGTIPAIFANLQGLTSLSLDNNNLSGPLPEWLTTLTSLRVLSIQNNNLSGTIPAALLPPNSLIQFTYRPGNPDLIVPPPSPQPSSATQSSKLNVAAIVGVVVGAVLGLILIIVIAIFTYRRCQRTSNPSGNLEATNKRIATTGGAKAYTFAEVEAATNLFDRELGKGGFGPVYYGKLPDGQEVAVKVAEETSKQGEKEFFNEVDVLSRVHHKNLVALVGYCQEQKQILIYEYMHNGSIFDHLHGSSAGARKLDWRMRLHIALNAAHGLEYLHAGCRPSFIHRDVKSSNILLTTKFDAKVADFGLTKLLGEAEDTRVMTIVMGTAGYLDPEYYTTQYISSKSDVYSFGIVLLELITGRLPIDRSATVDKDANLGNWVRKSLQNVDIESILDPVVKASLPNMESVWKVAELAIRSVEPKGVFRPTMLEVVQELQAALLIEGTSLPSASHTKSSGFSNYSSGTYSPTSFPAPR